MRSLSNRAISAPLAIAILLLGLLAPPVQAAEITDRSVSLSSSIPGESTNYSFNFSVPSSTAIQSFEAEVCEEASGSCAVPSGFDASSATLVSQPSGFGDSSGWSVDTTNGDLLRINNSGNTDTPDTSLAVTFGDVVNPTDANTTFYLRITTYENDDYTGEIDTGVVATSTGVGMEVTGFVPPILTFCVGKEISGDCSTATGDSIDMGTFSPNSTASDTSQMQAATNAGDGYVITVEGTTLTSGSNDIPELSSPTTSQTGTSQFGINLRDNGSPNVGEEPSGSGDGDYVSPYGTVDEFVYNSGDTIASATGPTDTNTYTVSYITNIAPFQAAGNYSTTLTYIATATF